MSRKLLIPASLALAAFGCTEPEPTQEEIRIIEARAASLAAQLSNSTDAPDVGVVVRLIFDETVDLDLYVTDPLMETVYFARHESRTGGVIDQDIRCETTGPRIEEIRFPKPWPGRYRVGVDFPQRCDESSSRAPAPFAVSVTANGTTMQTSGLVNLEFFEVVVLEFDVDEPSQVKGDS